MSYVNVFCQRLMSMSHVNVYVNILCQCLMSMSFVNALSFSDMFIINPCLVFTALLSHFEVLCFNHPHVNVYQICLSTPVAPER